MLKNTSDQIYKLPLIILDNTRIHFTGYTKIIAKYLELEINHFHLSVHCSPKGAYIKIQTEELELYADHWFRRVVRMITKRDCAVDVSKYLHKNALIEVIRD